MEWAHCREVHDMAHRIEIASTTTYIGAGLAWLSYTLVWEPAPWIAGLFGAVLS